VGNLTLWDLFLAPFFLLILIALAKRYRDKHYPEGHPLRGYFMKGLYAKLGGAIFIGLIYEYYYAGGDTYNYFIHSKIINSAFSDSIGTWFRLMMHTPVDTDPKMYEYVSQMEWYNDSSSYTVARIGAVLGLLNGTTYMPIALLFAAISYTGIWAMYNTFIKIYPTLIKPLALAFLFIPSTFVWGSSIFKDTICMFGLGWLVFTTFRVFVDRDFSVKTLLILALSFYLIAQVKVYILLAFIPALMLWLLLTYSHKVRSVGLRWIISLGFIALTAGGFIFFAGKFANELNKYSLENLATTAQVTRDWTAYAGSEVGSVYNLGTTDGTVGSLLSKFPQAVVVTLFRPFPWEARKVIVVLSALESLLFFYFTIKVIFSVRGRIFKYFSTDPNLIFMLVFSLIFAFAVGVSSGNFGALSRYKIPCLPFYAAFLMVLSNYHLQWSQASVQEKSEVKRKAFA
jgi:hypothetical protein